MAAPAPTSATAAATGAASATTTKPRISIIIGSTRKPRLGGEAGRFVLETLEAHAAAHPLGFDWEVTDLADWPLPLLDEPAIPQTVTRAEDYVHEHSQRWSRHISGFAGFVFVTPQYNWGYPAALKNAIDYLFNEWKGKPAAVVAYGGHGGNKVAAQLREVLQGARMRPAEAVALLPIPDGQAGMARTMRGEELGVAGPDSRWSEHRPQVVAVFEELDRLLKEPPPQRPEGKGRQ